jgi:hypothetical protein
VIKMSLVKKLAKGALKGGAKVAKMGLKGGIPGMLASGAVGAVGGFVAGRATAKGGKKKRRQTPAKLMNKIKILELKKKLARVRGY